LHQAPTLQPILDHPAEIGRLTATYLVTDGPVGRRISVLAVHSS
jgi:hypothetical protein